MATSSEPATAPGKHLALAEDVFFCVTEGQGIFLDLKQDDYCAVPVADYNANHDETAREQAVRRALEAYRSELLAARLVEDRPLLAEDFSAFRSIVRPTASIFHLDGERAFGIAGACDSDVRISAGDVTDVFSACARASHLLGKRHIYAIISAVRSRKARAESVNGNLDALKKSVAVFRKLRPWYPRGYLCLFDALALVEFLARRRQFPTWVFGVQAQPFGAHCWIQADDQLLNEGAEFANQFTPIMAV